MRLQIKHIPDEVILTGIILTRGIHGLGIKQDNWRRRQDVLATINGLGPLGYSMPRNLFQAKLRNMYKRRLIDVCCASASYKRACSGRIHLMEECPGYGCGA